MNSYPSYKDSGVEWTGDIPSHWECKRLQHISEIENSGVWGKDEPFEESLPLPIPTQGYIKELPEIRLSVLPFYVLRFCSDPLFCLI